MGQSTSYAGGAQQAVLDGGITSSSTAFQVSLTTGWPNTAIGPFVAGIDAGTASFEKVQIAAYDGSGNCSGVVRGYDGTTAILHVQGATIQPMWDAVSAEDDNQHIYSLIRDDHEQYLTDGRHDVTARHTFGAALGSPGTPTSVIGNVTSAIGSASGPAHSDHVHAGIAGTPTTGTTWVTGSNILGSSTTATGGTIWYVPPFAQIDGTSADITAVVPGTDTSAAGSVGLAADSGHTHAWTILPTGSTFTASNSGNLASAASTLAAISLTKGTWLIWGQVTFACTGATPEVAVAWIGTITNSAGGALVGGTAWVGQAAGAVSVVTIPLMPVVVSPTSTKNYYLVAESLGGTVISQYETESVIGITNATGISAVQIG